MASVVSSSAPLALMFLATLVFSVGVSEVQIVSASPLLDVCFNGSHIYVVEEWSLRSWVKVFTTDGELVHVFVVERIHRCVAGGPYLYVIDYLDAIHAYVGGEPAARIRLEGHVPRNYDKLYKHVTAEDGYLYLIVSREVNNTWVNYLEVRDGKTLELVRAERLEEPLRYFLCHIGGVAVCGHRYLNGSDVGYTVAYLPNGSVLRLDVVGYPFMFRGRLYVVRDGELVRAEDGSRVELPESVIDVATSDHIYLFTSRHVVRVSEELEVKVARYVPGVNEVDAAGRYAVFSTQYGFGVVELRDVETAALTVCSLVAPWDLSGVNINGIETSGASHQRVGPCVVFADVVPGEYLVEIWKQPLFSTQRERRLYVIWAEPGGNAVLLDIYDSGIYAAAMAFYAAQWSFRKAARYVRSRRAPGRLLEETSRRPQHRFSSTLRRVALAAAIPAAFAAMCSPEEHAAQQNSANRKRA